MTALLALAHATALDLLRRGSTRFLALVGVLAILSLRYFSAYALGYEATQLEEMGVYTLGICGAVFVLLSVLPRDDDDEGGEQQLITRPVPSWLLALAPWLGRLAVTCGLCLLWALALWLALAWFAAEEPRLFVYRGDLTVAGETAKLAWPLLGQLLTLAVLLAWAQAAALAQRPLAVSVLYAAFYGVGFLSAAWGTWGGRWLPDLARYDLTQSLWGASMPAVAPLMLHAALWTFAGLAVHAAGIRLRGGV